MGTINYKTSDYITLGLKPYDRDDFMNDTEYMDYIREEWGIDTNDERAVYNTIDEEISYYYEADYANIETELKKHRFYYYHVRIEPGYYEGFTLDIEFNFGVAFDSWEDRREAQKEITEIKRFLIECAGMGMVVCWPGWGTSYGDYKQTLTAINKAVKGMREEVKHTPTWGQYEKEA